MDSKRAETRPHVLQGGAVALRQQYEAAGSCYGLTAARKSLPTAWNSVRLSKRSMWTRFLRA